MRTLVLAFLAITFGACASPERQSLNARQQQQQHEQDERFQQQHRATLPDSF